MADSIVEVQFRPVEVGRPPFRHRYEVFSPKLERRLALFSWDAVLLWTLIEGTCVIDRFCERPGLVNEQGQWRLADFWVHHNGRSEYWLLANTHLPIVGAATRIDVEFAEQTRRVSPELLKQHEVLIRNWQSALPYVVCNRAEITAQQCDRILALCSRSQGLVDIERSELPADPIVTRSAVFDLVRRGALHAEDFHQRSLSAGSRFIAA